MITFIVSLIILLLGYIFYSRFLDRVFGIDQNRTTPAISMKDGVDYVPLPWWRIFLIQFLNIAGLGPIFGAVAGAMWGPVAFLWIVLGSVFAGAVHDYFSGMLSIRHNGWSITEIIGHYMGKGFKQFARVFTLLLMVIVGVVFVMGPAKILDGMTNGITSVTFWVVIVFIYYIMATLLPVDKLIGRFYPVFGFALIFMAIGILIMMFVNKMPIPELTAVNFHNMNINSDKFPFFPMMFITIACGAVSGFHSSQSPLMARCLTNERLGRRVFYGAMITEAFVAMIWAAIGMSFYGSVKDLNLVMNEHHGNAAFVVNEICNSMLGKTGGILALFGVVAAPITSGDTAFRSARLIIADFLNLNQGKIKNRILIVIPLFTVGFMLTRSEFGIMWRYLAWTNQTLATIVLWTITVYLLKSRKIYFITLIPAVFMTAVIVTYLFFAPEGFRINLNVSLLIGLSSAAASAIAFIVYSSVRK